jgi:hypothetical protein
VNSVTNDNTYGLDSYIRSVGAYLRQKAILIDDPYAISNLAPLEKLEKIPNDVTMHSFYAAPKKTKVFCHLCGSYRHFRGMIGHCDDGTAILFGSHCAKKYFGADTWQRIEHKRRQLFEQATQEHRGYWIHRNIEPTDEWLTRHMALISSIRTAWATLFVEHPEMTQELLDHLKRNRGRLLEEEVREIDTDLRSAGLRNRYLTTTKILVSLPSSSAIDGLADIDRDIAAVRLLCRTILETKYPTVSDFSRWDHHLSMNVRRGAENIDAFLNFSSAIFADGNLEICGQWLDSRRRERIDADRVSPRDAAKLLRKKVGYGYERPTVTLASTLPDFSLGQTLKSVDLRKLATGQA